MSTLEKVGPVQVLVVEFDRTRFDGEILPELKRLNEEGTIRVIDLLFVAKKEGGELEVVQKSDLTTDEATELGALAGALIGLGSGDEDQAISRAEAGAELGEDGHLLGGEDVWYLADAIPEGSSAAVVLIEHRWAIPLRDKLVEAGGVALADEWLHPADLVAIGAVASTPGAGGSAA
jgi:uncharacterized membrane protein